MDKYEKLVERIEKLEKEIVFCKETMFVPLEIVGGDDNGLRHQTHIGIVLKAICEKLNIRPIFKKEIAFTHYKSK